jgi:hypothetical protein
MSASDGILLIFSFALLGLVWLLISENHPTLAFIALVLGLIIPAVGFSILEDKARERHIKNEIKRFEEMRQPSKLWTKVNGEWRRN